MSESFSPSPHYETAYALKANGQDMGLAEVTVLGRNGSELTVSESLGPTSSITTFEHRTHVFTPEQVAMAAQELLPAPQDGEERLLSSALEETINNPDARQELILRLAGVAMGEHLNGKRDDTDYGLRTVEELVGDPDTISTNMWKVEDLISMAKTAENVSNNLALAHPNENELSLLSGDEAQQIRERIDNVNRAALNKLYDYYDVSFQQTKVFETTLPDGRTHRVSIYPSATERLNFIEKAVVDPSGTQLHSVEIASVSPVLRPEDGYIQVA